MAMKACTVILHTASAGQPSLERHKVDRRSFMNPILQSKLKDCDHV